MTEASVRDLRNHGGEVLDRVLAGERVTVTRDGKPVAELRGLPQTPLGVEALLERFRRLPAMDADQLRADVDQIVDQRL